ncbi:MAG TPA: hypothetical protein VJW76_10435 [Verrucomicrobiae bacterium]|nr:hypothetical protein [Verrucomicrobiae bacterium]
MRSPALAIAWEIWHRNRMGGVASLAVIGTAGLINWLVRGNSRWAGLAEVTGYVLLVLALFFTFGGFHFTEGRRKGGFGSFPFRLFNMPVATSWLVAFPMLYGSVAVLTIYLAGAWLIFVPLGKALPMVWPCLYLICAFTQFQMIIWSFPESRYLKLLCLSLAAAVIALGWMFFLPHIIEGTLSELGYTGSPALFKRYLFIGLALTGPAAFGISLYRVHQQRHGVTLGLRHFDLGREWISRRFLPRSRPFRSGTQAIFWQEWRQTGSILPIGVAAILAMTFVPTYLSGPLTPRATLGVLSWIFLSPLLLAVIIGRGFSKPDFWNQELNMTPFNAIRPLTSGQWVTAKLKVAAGSVLLTWGLVLYVSFVWTTWAGDFEELDRLFQQLMFHYSAQERWLLPVLAIFAVLILTWRFMVNGLAVGLSGRKRWYQFSNLLTGLVWVTLFAGVIWRSDHSDHNLHLYDVWQWIIWLPLALAGAVIAKSTLAAWAWYQVDQRQMLSRHSIYTYFGFWVLATGLLVGLVVLAFPHTVWLRNLLILLSMTVVPLARPGMAMLTLAKNRSGS